MENIRSNSEPTISKITIDTHFDFKLDGWPASAALITICLSGVIIYGIKVWNEVNSIHSTSITV